MPKTRVQKEEVVRTLVEKLSRMKAVAFSSFTGLTVTEAEKLRKQCREQGLDHVVAKKTLVKIALEKVGIAGIDTKAFDGAVATTISYDDEVAPAKTLAVFARTHKDQVSFLGGILEGKFLDKVAVTQLSLVPSKPELLSRLVGSINAPVSGFVNVLAGNLRGLVNVLNAVKESKS